MNQVNKLRKKWCIVKKDERKNDTLAKMLDWDSLPMLLDEKQAARITGVSVPFLRLSRSEGQRGNRTPGPQFVKLNGSVKYKKSELKRWVEGLPEKAII